MGRKQGPRRGSLQFWPRVRSKKILPSANWRAILESKKNDKTNLAGFIGYKAGMASAFVKDNTADSMTKTKRIILPVTILECPPIKILAVRFYKNGVVYKDILNSTLDKELKRIIRMPKNHKDIKMLIQNEKDFDDLTLIAYSCPKKINIKKTPDIAEIGLTGAKEEKIKFVEENLNKEISIADVFVKGVVDVRATTTGKGFQGSIKRFGVKLRSHKAEKGQRTVGSVGAWHPIGIRFRVPRAGQMGMQTRINYNNVIVSSKKISNEDPITKKLIRGYGFVRGDYILLTGSINGPAKRQVLITAPLRPTKNKIKQNYELLELR
jgi:large subunit ribosomal protein L3